MRNKIILAMAAAGMMYGASVYAVDPPTAGPFGSGKILFTGTITNSPCDIAPGDDAITVPFGQISYRKLNTADATTESKPFTIHLQNCAFDPNTPDTAGSAENVQSNRIFLWRSEYQQKGLHHQRYRTACWCPATEE